MITGLVSNCWNVQLQSGRSLQSLIQAACDDGLCDIELRQGSLGEYENEQLQPDVDQLARLASVFPQVRLNLAIDVPFLGVFRSADQRMFDTAVLAARQLSTQCPHLRLVDLKTDFRFASERACEQLQKLALSAAESGVLLSIEHSRQAWSLFCEVSAQVPDVKLCLDPCNLAMLQPDLDLLGAVRSLPMDRVSMLHIKQCVSHADSIRVLSDLSDGLVPWPEVLQVMRDSGYTGPVLLETAPAAGIDVLLRDARRVVAGW